MTRVAKVFVLTSINGKKSRLACTYSHVKGWFFEKILQQTYLLDGEVEHRRIIM
ncbi:MAG: hypothetical protein ACYSUC_01165 [Planctomycetota bacterium]